LVSPLSAIDDGDLLDAVRPRVIYGFEQRKDWYGIRDAAVRSLARASVAIVSAGDVTRAAGGTVHLVGRPLKDVWSLCRGEAFAQQPAVAFCSGTLVRPDVVLTAGHCVREISSSANIPYINSVSFVFGFRVEKEGDDTPTIAVNQVFSGKEVIGGELSSSGESNPHDWALVRLDRPVPSTLAEPVTSWRAAPVERGEKVFVIGFPSGIPLKYAPGAEVRSIDNPAYFVANLDTFGGNSGSGVYDQASQTLIGILVRGETDYVRDTTRQCMRVNVCPSNGCRGEEVTRIGLVPTP